MKNYRIKSPDEFVTMPWKNGLGQTIELYQHTPADSSEFDWRLSMADVTTDGPFSNFSGYDRTLLLLEGRGITLSHSTGHMDLLDEPLQFAQFRGEAETVATLLDGPIRDFNVMARRRLCTADVIAHSSSEEKRFPVNSDYLLIYAVTNDMEIACSTDNPVTLNGRHLLFTEPHEDMDIRCRGGAFIATQISTNRK